MLDTCVLFLLVAVHLYFLYRVWTEIGILWALASIVFPPLVLFIYYREWSSLKGTFFTELVLLIVHIVLTR